MAVDLSNLHHDGAPQNTLSAISNEMVRLYKKQFGRGPTKTRTNWAGSDVLVVTLEETFTPAERSLRRLGKHQELRDLRLLFQYAEADKFCEPIERLTGRKVRAFVSGIDAEADLATELFVLHPHDYEEPGRGGSDGAQS
ncbi:MAG TPA: Na-translocating system protein MpsC family protein [Solirubrobacteraceae bacterium]|nr:Na-translocating system protein MpsC family protein [Solirubrobacteraceae bacterium]